MSKKKSKKSGRLLAALAIGGGLYALYKNQRRLLASYYKLRPAEYEIAVERDINVPMPDGVILKADRYYPKKPGQYPTILIRTPYGREKEAGFFSFLQNFQNSLFAERGYNVVVQSVRGRFQSGGKFMPMAHEAEDGRATIEWLSRQPWFDGQVALWGTSYLGFVQWAVAVQNLPQIKAFMPTLTGSQIYTLTYPGGAIALDLVTRWAYLTEVMDSKGKYNQWQVLQKLSPKQAEQTFATAFATLPLAEADKKMLGAELDFYRNTFKYQDLEANPEYWEKRNHDSKIANVKAPAYLIGGWYDIFLNEILSDYQAMKKAGHEPFLTIGEWTHISGDVQKVAISDGLNWFDTYLKGKKGLLRQKPVKLFVMGENKWRELESFPPAAQTTSYFLRERQQLSTTPPANSAPDSYRYNPADPTPSVGGAFLLTPVGKVDNRELEKRADVLTYSTPPLAKDLEIIGVPKVVFYAKSSLDYTDFFARICDVLPDGTSLNICDGYIRLTPSNSEKLPDGTLKIEITLGGTACLFKAGHSLRLQISSGAHPRFNRNHGTGESLLEATELLSADQTIFHDQEHPSALILPVTKS